jgi:hypothetical protein
MRKNNWTVIHNESSKWARWMALYEAVNIICDKAEEKGLSLDKVRFDPLDIRVYISSTEDIILRKILRQEHNIDIAYSEEPTKTIEEFQFI